MSGPKHGTYTIDKDISRMHALHAVPDVQAMCCTQKENYQFWRESSQLHHGRQLVALLPDMMLTRESFIGCNCETARTKRRVCHLETSDGTS